MSDSEDDSILDNIQKTRELWSTKAETTPVDLLIPKSPISPPGKIAKTPSPVVENHMNGHHDKEDIIRFEDQVEEDFELPDVKSMKSQWEKAGPVPKPMPKAPVVKNKINSNVYYEPENNLIPVNREAEEPKEEYKVELGSLREKFEKEAKASTGKVIWEDGPRSPVSKAAVDQRVNMKKKHVSSTANKTQTTVPKRTNKRFETEIQQQKEYNPSKDTEIELPKVELSSIKERFEKRKDERIVTPYTPSKRQPRQTSISSDTSTPSVDIVRYDDPPNEEDAKYEIELSSIRKKFEQSSSPPKTPILKSRSTTAVHKAGSRTTQADHQRSTSECEEAAEVEIVKSSEAKYDQMTGEESVKDKLARYRAMAEESKKTKASEKFTFQKKKTVNETTVVAKEPIEEEVTAEEFEVVRSPPAGTKEKPEYTPSVDLQQTKQLFEESSKKSRNSRSSRSSSGSPQRRSPRSQSTPSPIKRTSRESSSASSKSSSPVRRNSGSSHSSGRGSPQPGSKKTAKSVKKVGDPDVVVLEHTQVNYYYEEGTRHTSKIRGLNESEEQNNEEMSNADIIKPEPAGTKEAPDFVPSINIRSVRDMFEHPEENQPARGRAPPPKKTIVVERGEERDSSDSNSPERNPDIVRSAAAGVREEPKYEISVDLKAARSKFESPQRPEVYVPRNTIRQREEEARQRRAAVAAASPRSSESSDSSFEVVKTTEAGTKEKPEYHVNLKAAKQLFESGGTAPMPKSVKKIFEGGEANEEEEEEAKPKSPIDIQQEARMAIRKEEELKEESKNVAENAKSSSDSESEHTDTEGEVILEQDTSGEVQEVTEEVTEVTETVEEKESSSSDNEANEEPAAAVVPVRVAISEDLQEDQGKEEEEPEPAQEYETYTKVIDYNEDTQQQAQSVTDSESENEKDVDAHQDQNELHNDVQGKDDEQQEDIMNTPYQNEVSNHISDSPTSEEQKLSSDQELSPHSTPSSFSQEKEGSVTPADDDESGYLQ